MNKIKQCLGILLLSLTVVSCRQKVVSPVPVDALPPIWPDYAGVTIPATIAPLNFRVTADGAEAVDVVISGKKGDPDKRRICGDPCRKMERVAGEQ